MNRQRRTARDLAQIAIFAALIAALGLPGGISIGSTGVMITFQTLGVMMAGAILGARKGFLAVLLFDVLVAAGVPLLSGARGGIVYVTTGPGAGYPWGWLLGAAVVGFGTERILPRYTLWKAFLVTAVGGMLAVYLIGVPVTSVNTGLGLGAAFIDSLKFWPGDILKVIVTVLIAAQVHRAYPGLIHSRSTGPARPAATGATTQQQTVERTATAYTATERTATEQKATGTSEHV